MTTNDLPKAGFKLAKIALVVRCSLAWDGHHGYETKPYHR